MPAKYLRDERKTLILRTTANLGFFSRLLTTENVRLLNYMEITAIIKKILD
jgi:hypothetical protein